jgi:GntR family transcriptional regulator/GntR family frlABCD operon transcriptional regulator
MESSKQLPQYRQLYELLRRHIIEGIYQEGDVLPSEHDLCIIHKMARITVRHALDDLARDGFIFKRKGKGSIVRNKPEGIGILSVSGTTTAMSGQNLSTRIIVKPEIRVWEPSFFFPLDDTEKESGMIYMERLRLIDDKPLFYDITFIPNINLPRFTARKFEDKSLFDTLRKFYNIEVTGGEQRLKAITVSGKIREYLGVNPNTPILHLERKIHTNRHPFSFYSSLYCDTQEYDLFGIF